MANFTRRCECGILVRISSIKATPTCPNCGAQVVLQKTKHEGEFVQEEPVTISPITD